MRWFVTAVGSAVVLALMTSAGCGRTVQVPPQDIEDARLVMRVKTALVNDPDLGPRVIEVRVAAGVATLSGLVASDAEVGRALQLARTVSGISDVRSQLVVGSPNAPPGSPEAEARRRPPAGQETTSAASQRGVLALGVSLGTNHPTNGALSSTAALWPLLRIGRSRGLGVTTGFSWFGTDLTGPSGSELGRVNVRPAMAGLNYTLTDRARWAVDLSLVGGLAFNSVTVEEAQVRDGQVIDVDNSLAMRPGVSLWYDVNSRIAVNLFGGYIVTRPQTTYLEGGEFTRRSLRLDTAVFSVGMAYKLF